jgi:hypothetical protein
MDPYYQAFLAPELEVRVVVVAFSLRVFLRGEASTGDNGNEVGILVVDW